MNVFNSRLDTAGLVHRKKMKNAELMHREKKTAGQGER